MRWLSGDWSARGRACHQKVSLQAEGRRRRQAALLSWVRRAGVQTLCAQRLHNVSGGMIFRFDFYTILSV